MNSPVEQHYSGNHLFEEILSTLLKAGKNEDSITVTDISGIDEFHVRGIEITKELIIEAAPQSAMKILDAGCGIGGLSRVLAKESGCFVSGIDISKEYIRTARLLSQLTNLDKHTEFVQADVLELPFSSESFHQVWTQHVQMNIADKRKFYSEINRVLIKDGKFIYYDIFTADNSALTYPLPWAGEPTLSHLMKLNELEIILEELGMVPEIIQDQTAPGILFFEKVIEKIKMNTLPSPNLGLLMGKDFFEKIENLYRQLKDGKLLLQSGIYTKPI